ncbi:hypothetical protein K1719_036846 [Acacia pycnantha]|nr:hypothetical protein K1719_036846 [Acacia pycnantha]
MAFNVIENAATASHRSFTVNYDGTSISVTLANTAAAVARWISETKPLQVQFPGKFVVGLGVQWTPGTSTGTHCNCAWEKMSGVPAVSSWQCAGLSGDSSWTLVIHLLASGTIGTGGSWRFRRVAWRCLGILWI